MKNVHFIGIGGSGLSALARLMLESGYTVSGSDRVLSPLAHQLANSGVRVSFGHAAENLRGSDGQLPDLVVRSSAIPDENPEVQAAKAAGIPVLKRSEFLSQLLSERTGIAVAGTHGKTTTTAMTAWVLVSLGKDPSYIIGGVSKDLSSNAHSGKGSYFVIEADEYDYMFLGLHPDYAIVTTVEHDHPDCFPTPADYHRAFVDFIHQLKPGGCLLVCQDDPGARLLTQEKPDSCRAFTYGLHPEADYRAQITGHNKHGGYDFRLKMVDDTPLGTVPENKGLTISLRVPGEHNIRNATAVLALAHQSDLPMQEVIQALERYSGTARRFDILGEGSGVTVIDDYAHHPTEIRATLSAARTRFPGQRIWVVWQPHTYSRTRALLAEFTRAFRDADQVIVTEIYAAREPHEDFSAAQVVEKMAHPGAQFIPTLQDTIAYLVENLQSGDVLLVLSAGDADQVSTEVLRQLAKSE